MRSRDGGELIKFGMHVVDAHHQLVGTVVHVRESEFVMRQQLGMDQLVAIPNVAVAGAVAGLVLLTITPGEIELFGRPLERRDRNNPEWRLFPRVARVATAH